MPESIEVQLEHLRGDIKALDTVVRMHVAEQKAINAQNTQLIEKIFQKSELMDARVDALERRQIFWYGGMVGLLGLSQILKPIIAKLL